MRFVTSRARMRERSRSARGADEGDGEMEVRRALYWPAQESVRLHLRLELAPAGPPACGARGSQRAMYLSFMRRVVKSRRPTRSSIAPWETGALRFLTLAPSSPYIAHLATPTDR